MGVPVAKPLPNQKKKYQGLRQRTQLKTYIPLKTQSTLKQHKPLERKTGVVESVGHIVPVDIVEKVKQRDGLVCLHPDCMFISKHNHHIIFKSGACRVWLDDIRNIFRFCPLHHRPTIHSCDDWRRFWEAVAVIRFGWLGGKEMNLSEYLATRKACKKVRFIAEKLVDLIQSKADDVQKREVIRMVAESVDKSAVADKYKIGTRIHSAIFDRNGKIVDKEDYGEGCIVIFVEWDEGGTSDFLLNPETEKIIS